MRSPRNSQKSEQNFIKEMIDAGIDVKEAADVFAVTESTISNRRTGASAIPLIYEKYFKEKYKSVLDLQYECLANRLKSMIEKLYKLNPNKAFNDLADQQLTITKNSSVTTDS